MAATPNGQAAAPNTDIADGASSKKGQRRTERFLVPIIFTVFVILRALDRVFLNRCMKIMGVYGGTLMALYWPICIQLMTVCICAGYVLMKRFSEGDTRYGLGWFSPVSPLASTHGRVPFYVMGVFSFFDQLNAAATAVPQRFLPEAMQTALTNTVVIGLLSSRISTSVHASSRFTMQDAFSLCSLASRGLWWSSRAEICQRPQTRVVRSSA
jgi:hypothetical protein